MCTCPSQTPYPPLILPHILLLGNHKLILEACESVKVSLFLWCGVSLMAMG